jgi:hypothetical protein
MMEAERDPEGDDEPKVEKQGRDEPAHPERDRQAGHQRDRKRREHQPAPGVPADAKPQRGQTRTDQREDGDARRALPVAASRVGQPREQRADSVLSRYSSCPIAQKTTSGTSATSRNSTARGQSHPAGLSSNTFDSQLTTFPL